MNNQKGVSLRRLFCFLSEPSYSHPKPLSVIHGLLADFFFFFLKTSLS